MFSLRWRGIAYEERVDDGVWTSGLRWEREGDGDVNVEAERSRIGYEPEMKKCQDLEDTLTILHLNQ